MAFCWHKGLNSDNGVNLRSQVCESDTRVAVDGLPLLGIFSDSADK